MKHILYLPLILIVFFSTLYAQVPGAPGVPLNVEVGFGGGVSIPSGDLSNLDNTGWHGLARLRIHGDMPINIVGQGMYSRLPHKVGSESDFSWIAAAGLECPLQSVAVKPYLGADVMLVSSSNTGPGASSLTRGGLGLGGGVEFGVPGIGSFDASAKYQMLNLMGKDTNESTASQIAVSLAIMFGM